MSWLALLPICFCVASHGSFQAPPLKPAAASWCEVAPALRAELQQIDARNAADCWSGEACWSERINKARELRDRHPGDLFANLTYQELVRAHQRMLSWEAERTLTDEYRVLASDHRDNAVFQFLYARVVRKPEEQRDYYRVLLERSPEFPWGYFGLAEAEAAMAGGRVETQQSVELALERFLDLCPQQVARVLLLHHALQDEEFWASRLEALRAMLGTAPPLDQATAYPALWELEFQTIPVGRHDEVRARVARDVAHLDTLDLTGSAPWWLARRQGLELTNDSQGLARLDADTLVRYTSSVDAAGVLWKDWNTHHARPTAETSTAERTAYWQALYEASTLWARQLPDNPWVWRYRLTAIEELPGLADGDVGQDLTRALDVWKRHVVRTHLPRSPFLQIADIRVRRRLGLKLVPALVDEEIAYRREWSRRGKVAPRSEEERRGYECRDALDVARLLPTKAEAYLRLGRVNRAQAVLQDAWSALATARLTAPGDDSSAKALATAAEAEVLRVQGELAAAEGRIADASAALLRAARLDATRPDLRERARSLWEQAEGTSEGWEALTGSVVAASDDAVTAEEATAWTRTSSRLKPFDLEALDGRHWTLEDLDGKVAFINVWATWCGPCRQELPEIERLAKHFEHRNDTVVVTFNIDSNIGAVEAFIKNNRYTFPVLRARTYAATLYADSATVVPRSFVVDRNGTVCYEQTGFASDSRNRWFETTLKLLEEHVGEGNPN